jgi:hypothetical protein
MKAKTTSSDSTVNPNPSTAAQEQLTGSEEAAQRFLAIAMKIPDGEVLVARVDGTLAILNCATGVAALAPHRDLIKTFSSVISLDEIDSLAEMGVALQYSITKFERLAPVSKETKADIATGTEIRSTLLAKADILVKVGIIPAAAVAAIRQGRGAIDTARDCLALAVLFRQYLDKLDGHVKVTADDITAADDIGRKLLAEIRPDDAPPPALAVEIATAARERDRLWTLYYRTWERNVWRAGALVFGRDEVDDHIPSLRSRAARHSAPPAPAPTPTPAPAPSPAPAPVATTDATTAATRSTILNG